MRIRPVLHRFLTSFVILGLLSGILQPVARAQESTPQQNTHNTFLPTVSDALAEDGGLLFRTRVTVRTTVQWRDLERMNPVFLDRGDDWALLLVDDIQLADLARLRYSPDQSNELSQLIAANQASNDPATQVIAASLEPLITQAQVFANRSTDDVTVAQANRATLQAAIHALDGDQISFLAVAAEADADDDGLSDTREAWWCTLVNVADSDDDGTSDGDEIAILMAWMDNQRAGPPFETPWADWPFEDGCPDKDFDSIPNLAETRDLGLSSDIESTDRDQFDDGQELFGTTLCPGSATACGHGSLPPANTAGTVLFPQMPSWVKAPGNHPLVAGLPLVEIDIVPSSLHVETVTTITTDKTISEGTEKSYSTAKTEGTGTSVANTETWNEWEETLKSEPSLVSLAAATPETNAEISVGPLVVAGTILTACGVAGEVANFFRNPNLTCGGALRYGADRTVEGAKWAWNGIKSIGSSPSCDTAANRDECQNQSGSQKYQAPMCVNSYPLTCTAGNGVKPGSNSDLTLPMLIENTNQNQQPTGSGETILQTNQGQKIVQSYYDIIAPLLRPVSMKTTGAGKSWGGSQTTTTEQYEELTVTNGEAFSTQESWGTATAVNTAYAANLKFSYEISNRGDDYARKVCEIAFNVYIGDDEAPAITYDVAQDLLGDGCLSNFRPDGTPVVRTSDDIPLSLEQMRAIDTGMPIRVVLSRFVLSSEDFYANEAAASGITFALEDGTDDGDETIDTYIIPTWVSGESVLAVLTRYFPFKTDNNNMLVAIWTPEYRSDIPSWCREPKRPIDQPTKAVWCKHDLSVADWWNVYTDGLGNGSEGFQDTQAVPGAVALFRFNQDSDHDGFSDRSETQLGTDPDDASSLPFPEVLAGVRETRTGNNVVATLSLLNTGFYDAYGVEAVMVAPDDSVTITNNTVGGSGRVRAQQQVIVGSRILLQSPLPADWTQTGHAAPAAGGYYTGNADRTYTFTVNCPAGGCSVGSGTWTVGWNDGAGGTSTLNFGSGYAAPTFLPVGNTGLTLALNGITVQNGESFTVAAQTPRDTFQYTINREPYTEPLVIVSYNDPQGNHRFLLPPAAMNLTAPTDNLQVFAEQMIYDIGVELVTSAPFTPGSNSVDLLVNNPSSTTLDNAHLFLEFINISGTVVSEVPTQVDILPGPNYVNVNFSSNSFNPAFKNSEEYIVMAFFTDQAGNILDTAGRPLSSFQVDPLPELIADTASLTWNFGTVAKGTLLKHPLAVANTGFGPLYTYIPTTPGLVLDQSGADTVGAADLSSYVLTLRTGDLPQGAYDQTVTIRTSDKVKPTLSLRLLGTITAPSTDTAGGLVRPLDVAVTVQGPKNAGQWVEFTHTLGPDAPTLHPVKVFNQDRSVQIGVGQVATSFASGTASGNLFGTGVDGNKTIPNGTTEIFSAPMTSLVSAATAGQSTISVNDATLFGVGQEVMIIQMHGSTSGEHDFARIILKNANQLTLDSAIDNSYTIEGPNAAQVVQVPNYNNVTIETNAIWRAPAWNGETGGIVVFRSAGSVTISTAAQIDASGKGYGGGGCADTGTGIIGPGYNHGWAANDTAPNSSGGGAGKTDFDGGGGGGGGNNFADATNGHGGSGSGGWAGLAGLAVGNINIPKPLFGGGGGGSGSGPGTGPDGWWCGGGGGSGGGIVFISAKYIGVDGNIFATGLNGNQGQYSTYRVGGGGGGAGGTVLINTFASSLDLTRVRVDGGAGGSAHCYDGRCGGNGGVGGIGHIHVNYCEFLNGVDSAHSTKQNIDCHVGEQINSVPYTGGRLSLPEGVIASAIYQVQYGRKLNYAGNSEQTTTLRVPAGIASSITLDALISGVGTGNVTFKLDVGNDGTWDWQTTQNVSDAVTLSSADLSAAFNTYWQNNGAPASGNLDVPIKVSLSKAGQVLLTNLQVNSAGSKLRHVQLPAQAVTSFLLDFTVGGTGSGSQTIALDVGADGSIDWSYAAAGSFPRKLITGDLKNAINTYLTGKSGLVNVPIRFYVAPDRTITLNDYQSTLSAVLDLAAGSPSGSTVSIAATPTEGDIVPLQATLSNASGIDSGPVTAAFFAEAPGWGDWYIGSAFVTNIGAGGNVVVNTDWDTTGFYGNVAVKVIVNPYGRLAETGVGNNVGTTSFSITPAAPTVKQDQSISFDVIPARTLGITPFSVSATSSSGLAVSIISSTPAVCIVSGNTVSLVAVGTCTLVASQGGNAQFNLAPSISRSFTVNAAPHPEKDDQTIIFNQPVDRKLGDADFSISASATSDLDVGIATLTPTVCTISGNTVTLIAVGTCTLVASQVGNAEFNPAPSVNRSFTVNPPDVPIDPEKQNQSVIFAKIPHHKLEDTSFAVSASATSDLPVTITTSTPTICTINGNTVTLVAVGKCKLVASQPGNAEFNPAPSVTQEFEVLPNDAPKVPQSITFTTPLAPTVNDITLELLANASSGLQVTFRSDTPATCTVSGKVVTLLAAGTCTIVATQAGNNTYEAAHDVTIEFTIKPSEDVPDSIFLPRVSNP